MKDTHTNEAASRSSTSAPMAAHASFLGMPRELRDLIYQDLLQDPDALRTDALYTAERVRRRVGDWFKHIYYPSKPPKHPILQVQLCNRQLCEETRETLHAYRSRDTFAGHLDIVSKDSHLWPTWISLPVISVEEHLGPYVDIDLRPFSTRDWSSDNQLQMSAYTSLWILLNQLVFNGPYFNRQEPLQQPLKIDNIRINLNSHPVEMSVADDTRGEAREQIVHRVVARVRQLAIRGVGHGNIRAITVRHGNREWTCKVLPPQTSQGVIDKWKRNGFIWGFEWRWGSSGG